MKLVIVESPTKKRVIQKYLGSEYRVEASIGHVIDIAPTGKYNLGIDIDSGNFEVTYAIVPGKEKLVEKLKELAGEADNVFLASDPDREGEAISYHLNSVLDAKEKVKRLEFHEITKPAILNALKYPRDLDLNLFKAQETRRIMDHIIGFRMSYLTNSKIGSKSAGRVQSAVLLLVYEKEKAIESFIPETTYSVSASFNNKKGKQVKFNLIKKDNKDLKIMSEEEAHNIINDIGDNLIASSVVSEENIIYPAPPLTTSTLQQVSHMSTKKTMDIAKALYENGYITYIRTDSIRVSPIAINQAKEFIKNQYGEEYIGKAYVQKDNGQVQDAHEAIRPTDVNLTPELFKEKLHKTFTSDHLRLYTTIYNKFICSMMKPIQRELTKTILSSNGYDFESKHYKVLFKGFNIVEKRKLDNGAEEALLNVNDVISMPKYDIASHQSTGPERYSEGSLVKKMEEVGIGRPSTYASTIQRNKDSQYIVVEKGLIRLTQKGRDTIEFIQHYFPQTINIKYTSSLEDVLDEVAEGSVDRTNALRELNDKFLLEMDHALKDDGYKKQVRLVDEVCPKCGRPLAVKTSKHGDFLACSGYPECNYIKEEVSDVLCPECGKDYLVTKKNARGQIFYACNTCKHTQSSLSPQKQAEETDVICPECKKGHLIKRFNKKGQAFYGCSRFPKCSHTQTKL